MLNSLITRENTGNFDDFGRLGAELWPKKPCLLSGFRRNSLLNGTGNFETSTANYFCRNREFSSNNRETALRFNPIGPKQRDHVGIHSQYVVTGSLAPLAYSAAHPSDPGFR